MYGIKNRLQPQELWWQNFKKSEIIVHNGDIIFDSDRLLIPIRQYFHLLDIATFDEYAFIAYNFLKAQSEMSPYKVNIVLNTNRITRDFKISLAYNKDDKDIFGGMDWAIHFETFKDNGNTVESEALLSQINARFHLSSTYITDESKRDKWIEAYCRHIMYTTVNEENDMDGGNFVYKQKTYRSAYPFQARKFAADWMRDINEFTDKDYNEYFNIECPSFGDEAKFLGSKLQEIIENKLKKTYGII